MNKKPKQYHIDVTEEEDAMFRESSPQPDNGITKRPLTFSKALAVVVVIHVVGLAALFGVPQKLITEKPISAQEQIEKAATPPPLAEPIVQPSAPVPVIAERPQHDPRPVEQKPTPDIKQAKPTTNNAFTKEYVVKQGDTVYSIAKKYKLNTDRLLKLNNIKDPNKIVVGQKLKFL